MLLFSLFFTFVPYFFGMRRLETNFLRLLSVTTHSTSSSLQLVQGIPWSTTSQRTLRARQQQHALEARLLIGRALAESPATPALRLPVLSEAVAGEGTVLIWDGGMLMIAAEEKKDLGHSGKY